MPPMQQAVQKVFGAETICRLIPISPLCLIGAFVLTRRVHVGRNLRLWGRLPFRRWVGSI